MIPLDGINSRLGKKNPTKPEDITIEIIINEAQRGKNTKIKK